MTVHDRIIIKGKAPDLVYLYIRNDTVDIRDAPHLRGKGTTGMEFQIIGTTLQAVILELDPGETVYSESGGMAWMSGNITMQTSGRGGGLGGMFKRAISGESLFLVEYTSQGGKGIA